MPSQRGSMPTCSPRYVTCTEVAPYATSATRSCAGVNCSSGRSARAALLVGQPAEAETQQPRQAQHAHFIEPHVGQVDAGLRRVQPRRTGGDHRHADIAAEQRAALLRLGRHGERPRQFDATGDRHERHLGPAAVEPAHDLDQLAQIGLDRALDVLARQGERARSVHRHAAGQQRHQQHREDEADRRHGNPGLGNIAHVDSCGDRARRLYAMGAMHVVTRSARGPMTHDRGAQRPRTTRSAAPRSAAASRPCAPDRSRRTRPPRRQSPPPARSPAA